MRSLPLCSLLLTLASPVAAQLTVNTTPVHYAMERSRIEGERDIVKLAQTSGIEEAWIFVKGKDGSETWYEVGEEETYMTVRTPDVERQLTRFADAVEVTHYHMHAIRDEDGVDVGQIPSGNDMKLAVQRVKAIKQMNVDFRVVTSHGVYVMKTGAEDNNDFGRALRLLDVDFSGNDSVWAEHRYRHTQKEQFTKENAVSAQRYSSKQLHITFHQP